MHPVPERFQESPFFGLDPANAVSVATMATVEDVGTLGGAESWSVKLLVTVRWLSLFRGISRTGPRNSDECGAEENLWRGIVSIAVYAAASCKGRTHQTDSTESSCPDDRCC